MQDRLLVAPKERSDLNGLGFQWATSRSGHTFVVRDDSNNSEITIKVDSSGNIHAVTTTSGSVTTDTNFGLIPISNSQEIEIEYDYDFQGGTQRMFVNGVQIGAPSSVTGTLIFLNSNGTRIVVGSDEGSEPITGDFDDLQIFANVQHTSDFSGEVPEMLEQILFH
ncbi:MAG: LamG-like jellyroll fold domain-containing protein [Bdellovibrionales bacterium]